MNKPTTTDGIESQSSTNYVGHFLLTNLIMPTIFGATQGSRITNVSSSTHHMADIRIHDWNIEDGAAYSPWEANGAAKSASILFAVALIQD